MADFTNKEFRRGDSIPHDWANWVNRKLSTRKVSGGPGMVARMGPQGPQVAYVGQSNALQIAYFRTTGVSAATWSAGVPTAWGTGTGYRVNGLNDVDSTATTLSNGYPDGVTITTAGNAKVVAAWQDDAGDWWLLPPSCTEFSAT